MLNNCYNDVLMVKCYSQQLTHKIQTAQHTSGVIKLLSECLKIPAHSSCLAVAVNRLCFRWGLCSGGYLFYFRSSLQNHVELRPCCSKNRLVKLLMPTGGWHWYTLTGQQSEASVCLLCVFMSLCVTFVYDEIFLYYLGVSISVF